MNLEPYDEPIQSVKTIQPKPWMSCTLDERIERWVNVERVLSSMDEH